MSERRYRFGPLEQRAVVGSLRIGQLLIVAAAALLGLGSMYALRSFWSLLVGLAAMLAAGATIFVPIDGRSADEWAPVALRWALRAQGRAIARPRSVRASGQGATAR